jgi:hypothetical protein
MAPHFLQHVWDQDRVRILIKFVDVPILLQRRQNTLHIYISWEKVTILAFIEIASTFRDEFDISLRRYINDKCFSGGRLTNTLLSTKSPASKVSPGQLRDKLVKAEPLRLRVCLNPRTNIPNDTLIYMSFHSVVFRI